MPASGQPAAASLAATRADILRACIVMGDVGDELRDLVAGDLTVGQARSPSAVVRWRTTSLTWSSVSGVARSSASSGTRSGPGTPSG